MMFWDITLNGVEELDVFMINQLHLEDNWLYLGKEGN